MPKRLLRLRSGSTSTSSVLIPAREASPASESCHSVFAVPPFPDSTTTDVAIRSLPFLLERCCRKTCERHVEGTGRGHTSDAREASLARHASDARTLPLRGLPLTSSKRELPWMP